MYNVYAQTNSFHAGAQLILDYQWHLSALERKGNSTLGEIFVYSPVRSRSGKQCKISPIQHFNVVSSLRYVGLMASFSLSSFFLPFSFIYLPFSFCYYSLDVRREKEKLSAKGGIDFLSALSLFCNLYLFLRAFVSIHSLSLYGCLHRRAAVIIYLAGGEASRNPHYAVFRTKESSCVFHAWRLAASLISRGIEREICLLSVSFCM